jgi:Fic family protein
MTTAAPHASSRSGRYLLAEDGPEGYWAFHPRPLPPDPPLTLDASLQALSDRANQALGRLDGVTMLLANPDQFIRSFARKEAVLSSQIEGTRSSLSDLLVFEQAGVPSVSQEDAEETANYIAAMDRGLAAIQRPGAPPLSARLLREVHAILLRSGRGSRKAPGEFRRSQNWIGGTRPGTARFVPPPWPEVVPAMGALERFLHDDPEPTPVLAKAALAHVQFETIHPFLDGNGRVGRCLIHVVYRRRGLATSVVPPISLVLATHNRLYIGGLVAYRVGELKDWLLFFAACTVKAVDRAHDLAFRVDALREDWLDRLGRPRSHASSRALLDQLAAEPVLTVARAAELANVSETAAARALAALERAGVLRRPSQQRWGRRWEAPEVFELLDAFERDVATPGHTARPARPAPRR